MPALVVPYRTRHPAGERQPAQRVGGWYRFVAEGAHGSLEHRHAHPVPVGDHRRQAVQQRVGGTRRAARRRAGHWAPRWPWRLASSRRTGPGVPRSVRHRTPRGRPHGPARHRVVPVALAHPAARPAPRPAAAAPRPAHRPPAWPAPRPALGEPGRPARGSARWRVRRTLPLRPGAAGARLTGRTCELGRDVLIQVQRGVRPMPGSLIRTDIGIGGLGESTVGALALPPRGCPETAARACR
jgi:hypothetical protein